jgi:hypothetical protein
MRYALCVHVHPTSKAYQKLCRYSLYFKCIVDAMPLVLPTAVHEGVEFTCTCTIIISLSLSTELSQARISFINGRFFFAVFVHRRGGVKGGLGAMQLQIGSVCVGPFGEVEVSRRRRQQKSTMMLRVAESESDEGERDKKNSPQVVLSRCLKYSRSLCFMVQRRPKILRYSQRK